MYDYTDEKIEPQQSRSFYPHENIRMQALMLRDCIKFSRGENMALLSSLNFFRWELGILFLSNNMACWAAICNYYFFLEKKNKNYN